MALRIFHLTRAVWSHPGVDRVSKDEFTVGSGEDFVGGRGPGVCWQRSFRVDDGFDGGDEALDRADGAGPVRSAGNVPRSSANRLSQDPEVGVKGIRTRGYLATQLARDRVFGAGGGGVRERCIPEGSCDELSGTTFSGTRGSALATSSRNARTAAGARVAGAATFTGRHLAGRENAWWCRGAGSPGWPFQQPGADRSIGGFGPRLDLRSFSRYSRHRLVGGVEIQPVFDTALASNPGSVAKLHVSRRHGCSCHSRQIGPRAEPNTQMPAQLPSRPGLHRTPRAEPGWAQTTTATSSTTGGSTRAGGGARARHEGFRESESGLPSADIPPASYGLRH